MKQRRLFRSSRQEMKLNLNRSETDLEIEFGAVSHFVGLTKTINTIFSQDGVALIILNLANRQQGAPFYKLHLP